MTPIAWFVIGNSSPRAEDRRIGWNIRRDGWSGFIAQHVEPAITAGAERILLHNPGGTVAGEPMQFAQFTHARRAGCTWILRDWEAWQAVTGRGVEVIAYMGALRPDMSRDFNPRPTRDEDLAYVRGLVSAGWSVAMGLPGRYAYTVSELLAAG